MKPAELPQGTTKNTASTKSPEGSRHGWWKLVGICTSPPRSFLRYDENTDAMSPNETMLQRLSSRATKLISYFQYCKNRRVFSEGPRCAGWWGCAHGITGPRGVKALISSSQPGLTGSCIMRGTEEGWGRKSGPCISGRSRKRSRPRPGEAETVRPSSVTYLTLLKLCEYFQELL